VSNNGSNVLVVGAGPVGLTAAAELARHGVTCRLVDKAPAPSATSKALGIMPRTLEVFAGMGTVDAVLAAGHRVGGANFHAGRRRLARVRFDDLDSPYPFVLILPQGQTEQVLTRHLEALGGRVERQVELTGLRQDAEGATAQLRHADGREEAFRASWLVGCDGAHSVVRLALDAPFEGAAYEEGFVLADVRLSGPLADSELHFFIRREGVIGFFPLGGGWWRVVADAPPAEAGAAPATPTLGDVQALVDARGPVATRLSDPLWLSGFRIHRRQARRYRQGRAFLAGDAAHLHSPAGGQGMNTGIQDAYNLSWKLALVAADEAPPELLDSYEAERWPVARRVLRFTDRLTRLLTLRNPVAESLRNGALSLLLGPRPVWHRLATGLAELDVAYRDSPLVAEAWDGLLPGFLRPGPAAGDRAPDGWLQVAATGEPRRLFEALRGTRHALLLFEGKAGTADDRRLLGEVGRALRQDYGRHVAVVQVRAAQAGPGDDEGALMLLDPRLGLHDRYGASSPCLYVVRPDGYIGFRGRPATEEGARSYFRRVLSGGAR
jgi:2-polyprenyl-6-methoxyphenol hydroxylase-like FAD-dependent oxidoreductase